MKYVITVEGETFEIELDRGGRVWINGEPYDVDLQSVDGLPEYSLLLDHKSFEAHVQESDDGDSVMVVAGRPYRTQVKRSRRKARKKKGEASQTATGQVKAPLPGLIVSLPVAEGQRVAQGDVVAVLESMKMNLELRAPRDGLVQSVHGEPGGEVKKGDLLVAIGPSEEQETEGQASKAKNALKDE
ncbi:MAG: acetyl-CoA carboxylase biotin carboxyl carrier protein subunit [Anaerolineales bacterium]|nr:MAG: acetyl-CoA carboxylase biotin carboxyl carrier protein subunit [Anaerolineales bacterium]